ncbi:MAG TPA: amidohydrolase family protein [Candidatus Binataceae bacterium]|nr:amidohydrolase family protein [Candidatus Binataceae bacterium]
MSYDLLIKNAMICDGGGSALYPGSVGVSEGKIVAIDRGLSGGKREINADGLTLAPGFIDIHTHYDAQISWDPLLTSSCWHGVTSVLMGNCGVGVAPCKKAERSVLAWDLVNVEAMSYDVLIDGVDWQWESFPDYIKAVSRRVALNVGFLVPLSALRLFAMGDEAATRAASNGEIQAMARILREALRAGAYGFSLSLSKQHIGYQGRPLASRLASRDELRALAQVMREERRGVIEINLPRRGNGMITDEAFDLIVDVARESQRPVTWLSLLDVPGLPENGLQQTMERFEPAFRSGLMIRPQTTCRPIKLFITLREPFIFASFPSWKPAFNRTREEQLPLYRSKEFRDSFKGDLSRGGGVAFRGRWALLEIARVEKEENKKYIGRSVQDLADMLSKDPVDAMLDLALDENLATGFRLSAANYDPKSVGKLITMPNVLIGLSDAGAHVDQLCDAGVPSYLLHEWVHEKQAMRLEEAVRRLTSEPADFLGLSNKGRVAAGKDADLVLFDPAAIKPLPHEWLTDLPTGRGRLVERSEGVSYSIIGGEIVFDHYEHQGVFPGQLLKGA